MPDNTPWTSGKIASAVASGLVPLIFSTILGCMFRPGEWFKCLNRPCFMPPGWVFAVVWTILYPLLGVGMIAACYGTDHNLSWILPVLNIVLSLLFTVWMFGLHSLWGGALITYLCFAMGVGLIAQYWLLNHCQLAIWLTIPYVLWLIVANILAAYMISLNPCKKVKECNLKSKANVQAESRRSSRR